MSEEYSDGETLRKMSSSHIIVAGTILRSDGPDDARVTTTGGRSDYI